jgi:hypothetical protein
MLEYALTQDERRALERIAGGIIPDPVIRQKIIDKGLAKQLLGGMALTDKGKRAMGKRF